MDEMSHKQLNVSTVSNMACQHGHPMVRESTDTTTKCQQELERRPSLISADSFSEDALSLEGTEYSNKDTLNSQSDLTIAYSLQDINAEIERLQDEEDALKDSIRSNSGLECQIYPVEHTSVWSRYPYGES